MSHSISKCPDCEAKDARIAETERCRDNAENALEAANVRIGELEAERALHIEAYKAMLARAERAEASHEQQVIVAANYSERAERAEAERDAAKAHVVDLEEIVKGVHFLRKKAEAELDGRNLAVIYCMERVEEDVKLLREALEGMIAVAEGRFDGNPHADIDALAKARAVALHLDRRPRQ